MEVRVTLIGIGIGRHQGTTEGVVIDSHQCPQTFAAEGLAASELLSPKSLPSFDPALADVFAIYVMNSEASSTDEVNPHVSGNYWIDGKRLNFIPRHPLKPGLTYRAIGQFVAFYKFFVISDLIGGI